jgi:restriction system protein
MALWLLRGGKHGEHEERFFETGQICLTWSGIEDQPLSDVTDFESMRELVTSLFPGRSTGWVSQNTSQFWSFVSRMQPGDIVVTPRKGKSAIAIGTIAGPYKYDASAPGLYKHARAVKWIKLDAPRSGFEQDLLYSFGAFTTICEVRRNDAEKRVREKLEKGFTRAVAPLEIADAGEAGVGAEEQRTVDLARIASDHIAQHLERVFKGHAMARLVGAILEAQGYTIHVSPEGPDKGIDILAAPGALGFGRPRICVQVKSGSTPIDRPTLDQLVGAMSNVGADQGLLVSWGGFKTSVDREAASQFFRVRLWDSDALVEQLLANYDKLPDDLRAEIPLQRVWALIPEGAE